VEHCRAGHIRETRSDRRLCYRGYENLPEPGECRHRRAARSERGLAARQVNGMSAEPISLTQLALCCILWLQDVLRESQPRYTKYTVAVVLGLLLLIVAFRSRDKRGR
jgi:hypothetical protein